MLTNILWNSISYYDYGEDYYHGMLNGIFTSRGFSPDSNDEAGLGRLNLRVRDRAKRAYLLLEFKRSEKEENLDADCDEAIAQIFEKGYDKVSHSRIARFEILYEFIKTITKEENLTLYKELLTYDLYLRENVKKRPDFAGDYTLQKDDLRYINEEILLKDEQLAYFGKKNMRKLSHMERFDHVVNEDFEKKETILLFDYQNRDPLTNQATVYSITMN